MSIVKKLGDFIGSGFLKSIGDVVDRFVTTGEEKEKMKREMAELVHRQELDMQRISLETEQEFDQRLKDLEGTTKDLNQAGWLGRVALFFRGLQRPLWGYLTLYMDLMVFSGCWKIEKDSQLESAFWLVNFLVLGFLFGERAVKNVVPLVQNMLRHRQPPEPRRRKAEGVIPWHQSFVSRRYTIKTPTPMAIIY